MEIDNQTLLYIVIALAIVQFLLMRYYVSSSLESEFHQNNKKIIRRVTGQMQTTLQQHLGGGDISSPQNIQYERIPQKEMEMRRPRIDRMNQYKEQEGRDDHQGDEIKDNDDGDDQMDSMDDPVGANDED